MKTTFHITFQDSADEIKDLHTAYEELPDSMSYDVAKCFKLALEQRAYKLIQILKDEVDAGY